MLEDHVLEVVDPGQVQPGIGRAKQLVIAPELVKLASHQA